MTTGYENCDMLYGLQQFAYLTKNLCNVNDNNIYDKVTTLDEWKIHANMFKKVLTPDRDFARSDQYARLANLPSSYLILDALYQAIDIMKMYPQICSTNKDVKAKVLEDLIKTKDHAVFREMSTLNAQFRVATNCTD